MLKLKSNHQILTPAVLGIISLAVLLPDNQGTMTHLLSIGGGTRLQPRNKSRIARALANKQQTPMEVKA